MGLRTLGRLPYLRGGIQARGETGERREGGEGGEDRVERDEGRGGVHMLNHWHSSGSAITSLKDRMYSASV